jgi:hypothetical protein
MNEKVGKYFENGDSLIKVLSVIETDIGNVYICLHYSSNHKFFHIENLIESDFQEIFEPNEISYGEDYIPIVNGKQLL